MRALVPLHDQPTALAELLLEPVVALLHVADLREVALVVVERLDRRLLGGFDADSVAERLLHLLLLQQRAPLGRDGQAEVRLVDVHQPLELVFVLVQFLVLELVPVGQRLPRAFAGLLAEFDLLLAHRAVEQRHFVVELVALQVLHGHVEVFGLQDLAVDEVVVLLVVPRAWLFAQVVQTRVLLLGPRAAARTRLGQHAHRQARTPAHLLGPVLDLPQPVLLALDRKHLLLERLRVHLVLLVHGHPLEVVRHINQLECRRAESVRVEVLVVFRVGVLLFEFQALLAVHETRVEAGRVARGDPDISFPFQVVVQSEFY